MLMGTILKSNLESTPSTENSGDIAYKKHISSNMEFYAFYIKSINLTKTVAILQRLL